MIPCFLPIPGRLEELLRSGVHVLLRKNPKEGRKTSFDLIAVEHTGKKLSLDTRVPNQLVARAQEAQ